MSENTSTSSSDDHGYDPGEDQDSDPESLQPRTGDRADSTAQTEGDPDADPDMLNPRDGGAAV